MSLSTKSLDVKKPSITLKVKQETAAQYKVKATPIYYSASKWKQIIQ